MFLKTTFCVLVFWAFFKNKMDQESDEEKARF
jgi:hypothetical protein